ncbi:MAG TPA: stage II sporulation protein M [Rugosimonospora sp.]
MDLDAYVAEHAGEWRRLEQLAGRRRLGAAEVDEMIALYQRTGTHLSAIRSRAADPALVARLSRIVLTARGAITGGGAFSWSTVGRFFTTTFPLAVFQAWRWWCAVATSFTVLSFALMWYVASHPDFQHAFLTDDQIQQLVNSDFVNYYSQYQAQNFALQVWTNNALITALCLASGVLVIPVFLALGYNLLNVGLDGGLMIAGGRSEVFFGLILPHGLLELTAVFVAAGVGLRIGWSWIAPGPLHSRGQALGAAARSAMLVALGLVGVLAISGLIEAFVTPSGLPTPVRIAIGVLAWGGFLSYVVVRGGRASRARSSADLAEEFAGAAVPTV